ncbi:MAG: cyclase, partial [Rhodospirillales bacterium]|nr:cyclase [Rhodospirillales bacterium]
MANPNSDMRVTRALLSEYAEKYKNWGKWGPDDEIGTLNYTKPEDIVGAAQLVKKGKTMSLGLNYDQFGPQGAKTPYPAMGRFNPIHMMTRTGTDAYSGVLDHRGIRGADDLVMMPLQCGTQWDGLGHVFYEDYMWNGYDCREVTTAGAQKAGIEKTKDKMVGRGVFLDIPRVKGLDYLEDGYPITCADLEEACEKQNIDVREGDYVVLRTGMMERCLNDGSWDGYAGGDAAGLAFETLDWIFEKKIAGYASDT